MVSSRVVTFAEVQEYSRPAAESLQRQYYAQSDVYQEKLNEVFPTSLNQLVERLLILHSFDTDGYKLPESVVDELVNERIRDRFGDRVTFMKPCRRKVWTVEQFRKQVRDQYIESALRKPERSARNLRFTLQGRKLLQIPSG